MTSFRWITPTEHADLLIREYREGRLHDSCVLPRRIVEGWNVNVPGKRAPYLQAYILQTTVGLAPSDRGLVFQSCGNSACISPRHLRWDRRLASTFDTGFVARSVEDIRFDLA